MAIDAATNTFRIVIVGGDIAGLATAIKPTYSETDSALQQVFESRYKKASLIQAYSRQQAKPATEKGSVKVTLNPAEFLDYNCRYEGAVKWLNQQRSKTSEGQ